MKIACIGWGSLIWQPKKLAIVEGAWHTDGPLLPIEFTRISTDDRVTLIVDPAATLVPTFWQIMTVGDVISARESLKVREGTSSNDIRIARAGDKSDDPVVGAVIKWLRPRGLDAAIWTGLSFSAKTGRKRPTISDILKHLESLSDEGRVLAEEYIRNAPVQIDTEYRRAIIQRFGWTPEAAHP